jgi:hypothetical protein
LDFNADGIAWLSNYLENMGLTLLPSRSSQVLRVISAAIMMRTIPPAAVISRYRCEIWTRKFNDLSANIADTDQDYAEEVEGLD